MTLICLLLHPEITTSHIVTSEVLLTFKNRESVEFAKTTSPSAIIDNLLPEIVSPKLSAPL